MFVFSFSFFNVCFFYNKQKAPYKRQQAVIKECYNGLMTDWG